MCKQHNGLYWHLSNYNQLKKYSDLEIQRIQIGILLITACWHELVSFI